MKSGVLILALVLSSSMAFAESMSCIYGVFRAGDLLKEDARAEDTNKMISLELKDDAGETEVQINGETLSIDIAKREYADVYDLNVVLMTPEEDRIPKTQFVAAYNDYLINEGPAKDNGWTVDYKPGAITYSPMQRPSGTFALTGKMRKALIEAGLWGKHPFTTSQLDPQYASYFIEPIIEMIDGKKLKATDVVAFGTTFSCTKNK